METLKFIQSFSNPFLDNLFQFITMLGEEYFYIVTIAIIFWCINKKLGYKLGFSIILSLILNGIIKNIFQAPRPIGQPGIRSLRTQTATGYSFPSGHSQGASAFWSSMILILKKTWLSILGITIVFLVALSRLYLGVHWPQDVISGIIFGFISVLISNFLFNYAEKSGNKYVFLIIFIPALLALFIFKNVDYAKTLGISFGFYIGYILESSYVNFEVKTILVKQVIKILLGTVILLIILKGTKQLLPKGIIFELIRYFTAGIFATAGIPFIFKKLNL